MEKLRGPSAKQLEVILSELREYDGKLDANISALKTWISYQPHLPKNYDENLLSLFIRGCKHDLARARSKMDVFWCARTANPDIFNARVPMLPGQKEALNMIKIVPLPRLTDEGCRVTMHRIRKNDENTPFNTTEIIRLFFMLGDLRMSEESALAGDVFVFDCKNLRLSHCVKLATPIIKKALNIVQDGYPQRLKQIHIVNAPSFISKLINMFKGLMKEKMRNRFVIHSSADTLVQYIPAEVLPEDYCGKEQKLSVLNDLWIQKLEGSSEFFSKLDSEKADISKKVTKMLSPVCQSDSMFGYEGAFRKLTID